MGSTNWTPADIDLLKTLWAKNLSASQLMHHFQFRFSRSAICGKVMRLKLPGRAVGQNISSQKRGPRPRLVLVPKRESPAAPLLATVAPIPSGPIGNFPDTQCCRWPTGEGATFQCCGADGYPWCDHHKAMAWAKPNVRIR